MRAAQARPEYVVSAIPEVWGRMPPGLAAQVRQGRFAAQTAQARRMLAAQRERRQERAPLLFRHAPAVCR